MSSRYCEGCLVKYASINVGLNVLITILEVEGENPREGNPWGRCVAPTVTQLYCADQNRLDWNFSY